LLNGDQEVRQKNVNFCLICSYSDDDAFSVTAKKFFKKLINKKILKLPKKNNIKMSLILFIVTNVFLWWLIFKTQKKQP